MGQCARCGNEYDKTFEVHLSGKSHQFDSFECAIALLAPVCQHCGCQIIGHGVEAHGLFFCCVHCAKQAGIALLRDRE